MSGPLIFISRSRVKPGKAEEYKAHCTEATDMIAGEEPRMIAFNHYESEDGTEVSTVQVHPDADSLDSHLKLYADRLSERVAEAVDSYEIDVYGSPSESALDFLRTYPLRVRVLPVHTGGFLRPQPL